LALKTSRKTLEIFSLSFLDIISCGFGAVVLLVLISNYSEAPLKDVEQDAVALLDQVMRAELSVEKLQRTYAHVTDDAASKEVLLDRLLKLAENTKENAQTTAKKAAQTRDDIAGLSLVQKSLERAKHAALTAKTATKRDEEVGGIPVDSDYVVFIIDTSGSMKQIWGRVTAQVENIIRIHPAIKGFQVLNDNGAPILSAYSDKWIPDTPARRKGVIELLETWKSASNSSPVEGLSVALKRYANPNLKVSIYIFGDDYSGSSYDQVIDALDVMNTNRVTGQRLARVHGVGFLSPYSTMRFATLMREVTRRNNGTFIALPP
tara:strand:- start:983 stop:1942 length:960 start_codon:yes stop_codon:yes gene_type:complete